MGYKKQKTESGNFQILSSYFKVYGAVLMVLENKLTAVKFYGLSECKVRADLLAAQCNQILEGIPKDTAFLHELVDFVKNRRK